MEDWDLIDLYARQRSEEAFSTLATRYLDLIHSAAWRQTGDAEHARDVTQAVLLILARKASSLGPKTILPAWLYRTTRYVALESIRAEKRRKLREAIMAESAEINEVGTAMDLWEQVAPHLDAAMAKLNESDRSAVLLRFFQDRTLLEVGTQFGISEEAAKKRVSRALDRLRRHLSRYGITSSRSLLGSAITAYAIYPAPAGAAAMIPAALGKLSATSASVHLLTKGTLQMIAWTKMKTAMVSAVALVMLTGTVAVSIRYSHAVEEQAGFGQPSGKKINASFSQNASMRSMNELEKENKQLRQQSLEVLRLRNNVGQLRAHGRAQIPGHFSAAVLRTAPLEIQKQAEELREMQFERFVAAGSNALELNPLSAAERAHYNDEITLVKYVGLALRLYATNHKDEFPPDLQTMMDGPWLEAPYQKQLQDDRYQYNVFKAAETKPDLPAVWSRIPDEKGIRVVVFTDGSARLLREPTGLTPPPAVP